MKKQKWIVGVLAGLLTLSLMSCGDNDDVSSETSTQAVKENTTQEEQESKFSYSIISKEYNGSPLNDKLIAELKDGKVGVITYDGELVLNYQYDDWMANLYDGSFVLKKEVSDDESYDVLFDKEGNQLFSTESVPYASITSYSDGLLQLSASSYFDAGWGKRFYDGLNDFSLIEKGNFSNLMDGSAYYNGMIVVMVSGSSGAEFGIIDTNGEAVLPELSFMANQSYCVSDEGYVIGTDMQTYSYAVYNVNTGKMYYLDDEIKTWIWNKVIGGGKIVVYGDGYMIVNTNEESDNLYAAYHIEQGFLTDEIYSHIGLFASMENRNKYTLISNEDGSKWSYLDENFREIGTWYDDATDFYNGFAIIKDSDGLLYFINEQFEKVSEGFEGMGASLSRMGYFEIMKAEDVYYLVDINEKNSAANDSVSDNDNDSTEETTEEETEEETKKPSIEEFSVADYYQIVVEYLASIAKNDYDKSLFHQICVEYNQLLCADKLGITSADSEWKDVLKKLGYVDGLEYEVWNSGIVLVPKGIYDAKKYINQDIEALKKAGVSEEPSWSKYEDAECIEFFTVQYTMEINGKTGGVVDVAERDIMMIYDDGKWSIYKVSAAWYPDRIEDKVMEITGTLDGIVIEPMQIELPNTSYVDNTDTEAIEDEFVIDIKSLKYILLKDGRDGIALKGTYEVVNGMDYALWLTGIRDFVIRDGSGKVLYEAKQDRDFDSVYLEAFGGKDRSTIEFEYKLDEDAYLSDDLSNVNLTYSVELRME